MPTSITAYSIIQGLAAMYLLVVAVCALNRMGPCTRHMVRVAHVALGTGAVSAVVACFHSRGLLECLFALGVAIYVALNRHKKGCCT